MQHAERHAKAVAGSDPWSRRRISRRLCVWELASSLAGEWTSLWRESISAATARSAGDCGGGEQGWVGSSSWPIRSARSRVGWTPMVS
ncbi:hypothetical protein VR43_31135 [Streptomyces sp. NRRL S-104]|nr:hypothetical protein VR43_31135 [Streptomyces sp. NRRL S-104]